MQAPKIDKREYKDIIRQITEMLPFYAPDLRFNEEDRDMGAAVIKIFARMFEGTIKRLNQVPDKNLIAFLNMLGAGLLPAQPARVPVTFKLGAGAASPVLVKSGTQVAANLPDGGKPVIFETEKSIMATPARIVEAFYSGKKQDFIVRLPEDFINGSENTALLNSSVCIFDFSDKAENLQKHTLFLGDKSFFDIKKPADINIHIPGFIERTHSLSGNKGFKETARWKWYYCCGETVDKYGNKIPDWREFDYASLPSGSENVVLKKKNNDEIKEYKINDISSRWIKCEVIPSKIAYVSNLLIDTSKIRGEWNPPEITPDNAFCNNVLINPGKEKNIYPFGFTPRLNDAFYLASREAFSIKDTEITISFETDFVYKKPDGSANAEITAKLSWEYWNGTVWARLQLDSENNLNSKSLKTVAFQCPADIKEAEVNGQTDYWIRCRIISGDYGRDVMITSDNKEYRLEPKYSIPCLKNIAIKSSKPKVKYLDEIMAYNNLQYDVYKKESENNVKVFNQIENDYPCLYFGLDKPLEKSPVSVFVSILEQNYKEENLPAIRWEYISDTGEWKCLDIEEDSTKGLTHAGNLVFGAPQNFAAADRFGKKLYWIRAVDIKGIFDNNNGTIPTPKIKGVYINTTWAVQSETFMDKVAGSSDGSSLQEFNLAKTPISSLSVWVNEMDSLLQEERKDITASGKYEIKEVNDKSGNLKEFWIRWIEAGDLLESGPSDRHYTVDPAFGIIKFGDGINGAIPPRGVNNIKTDYRSGGGLRGNIKALEISSVKTSTAYIDGAFNPEAAGGGFGIETVQEAFVRGPQLIRHRNRAVTPGDYEWLARQASREIARVKCLPNYNDENKRQTGWITMVIVPGSSDRKPVASLELKHQVESFLRNRTSEVVIALNHLRVIDPLYVEVTINAELKAKSMSMAPLAEKEAYEKLNAFLHPITGGFDKKGWEFGRVPYLSDFYQLLEAIDSIDHVELLSMIITDTEENQSRVIDSKQAFDSVRHLLRPDVLVFSGKHSIKVY